MRTAHHRAIAIRASHFELLDSRVGFPACISLQWEAPTGDCLERLRQPHHGVSIELTIVE